MNLARNGGFTTPWSGNHRVIIYETDGSVIDTDRGEIFVPTGWDAAFYLHGLPVEHDPKNDVGWAQPEIRDSNSENPDRFGLEKPGQVCFTFSRIHHAGLFQVINGVEVGEKLFASAFGHAWSNSWDSDHVDDPKWSEGAGYDLFSAAEGTPGLSDAEKNFTFRLGIDPAGGTDPFASTVVWGEGKHIYNGFDEVSVEATAEAETVTLFLSTRCLWPYKHNDAYWDDVQLLVTEDPQPNCKGEPRAQFKRTYVLFPDHITPEERGELAPFVHRAGQWTAGTSADDAGVANLDDKTVLALDPKSIGTGIDQGWYDLHYGTAPVVFKAMAFDIPEIGYEVPPLYTTYQMKGRILAQDLLERGLTLMNPSTHPSPLITKGGEFGNDRGTYIHNGLDLRASWAAYGDHVVSAKEGKVIRAGYYDDEPWYGWQVRIQTVVDDYIVLHRYAHMVPNSVAVKPGDWLPSGYTIGKPDNTGNSTGDHLHFDVKVQWAGGSFYADPAMLIKFEGGGNGNGNGGTGGKIPQNITVHVQTEEDGYLDFIARVQPNWAKFVGNFEAAKRVKDASPNTKVLIRQKIDHQGRFLDPLDVNAFLATFKDSLEANAQWIDAFEGLNEEAPTPHLVEWMIKLSNVVFDRYGHDMSLCAGNLAVGNGEGDVLWPAAQVLAAHNHYFGYHTYWPANLIDAERWMEEFDWAYHMRDLLHLDPHFTARGAYVRWLGTESGAVGSDRQNHGGPGWLNPGAGWRSGACLAGDRPRMIALCNRFKAKVYDWNVQHDDRKEADMLFTVGAGYVGWKDFKYWKDDMDALANALV